MTKKTYEPRLAWLRALAYFAACIGIAAATGVLPDVLAAPLATPQQLGDAGWWALTLIYLAVILGGYAGLWPRGTFTDGRERHAALSLAYGLAWGLCQGLWFLTIWTLVARSGLAPVWVAAISYLLIGGYNGVWHRFVWDIYVSPPHNYTEWNGRKVLLCHTPNLLLGLALLALYGNGGIFVLMQGLALAISAYAMRFPAPWDAYRAVAGEERSIARKAA